MKNETERQLADEKGGGRKGGGAEEPNHTTARQPGHHPMISGQSLFLTAPPSSKGATL
jgi:hypothetical protein